MNQIIADFVNKKKGLGFSEDDAEKAAVVAFGVATAETAKELKGKQMPAVWDRLMSSLADVNKLNELVASPDWEELNKMTVNDQNETLMVVFNRHLKNFLDQV
jgi:hypothetical protein